ncbi:manganese-dependent ADP-ribose/CDP-alcohol diphosphatase [Cololabis saira]|uniref:manganese-dependent ADP-ribose/CDP-alcohol diphosphatase n=1 Tax=Cololabis saira TaxID=129043 RepID=UPI002AD29B44|nr:manganese-dependent ADP-ribose/CDP-alcohol diphosphatase [Cololabis saira]
MRLHQLIHTNRRVMDPCVEQTPLFTFGVIADVQYADIDDGYNYTRTRRRFYRSSLRLLANALRSWSEPAGPAFILQLGDLIDGFNKPRDASEVALRAVLEQFGGGAPRVHHVWGNHEFYNFSRAELLRSRLSGRAGPGPPARPDLHAYHFSPRPGFRFVVLDAYDVSVLGREESSEEHSSALSLLRLHNHNTDLNCPPASGGLKERFTKFNGGFGKDQLAWLDSVLSSADESQEKVTLVSHLPAHPGSTEPVCLAWNYDELLALIRSHGSVVCYMAGHAHDGGYCRDEDTGVHHLTLDGVIETPPDSDAFATVSVYTDRMLLKGSGRVTDRVFKFPCFQYNGPSPTG